MTKITRRMKWIVQKMTEHGAYIQERRDAFLEKSWWQLVWNEPDDRHCTAAVTEKMRCKLIQVGLIQRTEHNPVYRHGKFITSEAVYTLTQADGQRRIAIGTWLPDEARPGEDPER